MNEQDLNVNCIWGIINGISESNREMLQVYPNPFENHLVIKSFDPIRELKVFNVLGKVVYSSTPNSNLLELNLENFEKGIYFIETKSHGYSKSLTHIAGVEQKSDKNRLITPVFINKGTCLKNTLIDYQLFIKAYFSFFNCRPPALIAG